MVRAIRLKFPSLKNLYLSYKIRKNNVEKHIPTIYNENNMRNKEFGRAKNK